MIKKINKYLNHLLPGIRGFLISKNISFISIRSKIQGKLKVGFKTRIFEYTILNGNIKIGDYCSIHEFSVISGEVKIGDYCRIANSVKIHSNNHGLDKKELIHKQKSTNGKIEIEDDVWIGAGAIILKNVKINKGAVIGAGAVVTKNVPRYEIWAGNPAKKISERK